MAADISGLSAKVDEACSLIERSGGTLEGLLGAKLTAVWADERHSFSACGGALALFDLNGADCSIALDSGNIARSQTPAGGRVVLGDAVLRADRMKSANKFFGTHMVVGESTYKGAGGGVRGRFLGAVNLQGSPEVVKIFELIGSQADLTSRWATALPKYEDGISAFMDRDFKRALAAFQIVAEQIPNDSVSRLYAMMSQQYQLIPPDPAWNGAFNLTA